MKRKNALLVILAAALFATGLLLGSRFGASDGEPAAKGARVLFYRNPMNPAITSPTPAKDEMGMDYIPVVEGEADQADAPGVTVAPEIANSLGVRTEAVARGEIARRIESVGYVGYDEHRLSHVHLRAEGWIEGLQVHAAGESVRRGQLLFRFYSPELVNAQEEFLLARGAGDARLVELSRRRLAALGLPQRVIAELERTGEVQQRLPVYAAQDGAVAQLNVREGMFVGRDMDVLTLVDLSSVWLLVDVFEQQAAWVRVGERAEVRLASVPGRTWEGRVDYIYPELDATTRTLRVRLRFANPHAELKPNMYATATLFAAPHAALHVPREAVIRTGTGAHVMLARADGRFEPVTVETGVESGDRLEILKGLQEGERVVVSAQFLLDSEASLRAALRRMGGAGEKQEPAAVQTFAATGTLKGIDTGARKLQVTHDPIRALGWPAMTMDFPVAAGVSLDALAPGMRIHFDMVQRDPTTYEITAVGAEGGGQ